MDQLIAYISGVLTPITLFFIYCLIVLGSDNDD